MTGPTARERAQRALLAARPFASPLAGIAFFLSFLHLPHEVPTPALDDSWQQILAWAAFRDDVVFGRDLVFTFGPLGFLRGAIYAPELYTGRALFACAQSAGLAALFVWHLRRLGGAFEKLAFVYVVCALIAPSTDGKSFAAVLALAVWVAETGHPLVALAAGAAFAVLGLEKFSLFVLAAACTLGLVLVLLAARRRGAALALALGAPAALVLLWLATGQPLAALPDWLARSSEIAGFYPEGMGFVGRSGELALSALLLAALAGFVAAAWTPSARPERLLLAGVVLGWAAVVWKAGFTRHDDGHTLDFFSASLLVFFVVRGRSEPRWLRPAAVAFVALAFLTASTLGSPHFGDVRRYARGRPAKTWMARVGENAASLLAGGRRAEMDAALARERARSALPAVARAVGSDPVDFFGHSTGWVFLNRLAFALRPTIQNYNAYSEPLQRLDAEWYAGPDAPPYSLVSLEAIDERWPLGDASLAFAVLRRRYEPVLVERGLLLLRLRPGPDPGPVRRRPVREQRVRWNEEVPLEAGARTLHASLAVRRSAAGRLRAALWRPARVHLELRFPQGWQRYQLIPSQAEHGFPLAPALRNAAELVRWVRGAAAPHPLAFRLSPEAGTAWAFEEEIGVRLERGARAAFAGGPHPRLPVVAEGDAGGAEGGSGRSGPRAGDSAR